MKFYYGKKIFILLYLPGLNKMAWLSNKDNFVPTIKSKRKKFRIQTCTLSTNIESRLAWSCSTQTFRNIHTVESWQKNKKLKIEKTKKQKIWKNLSWKWQQNQLFGPIHQTQIWSRAETNSINYYLQLLIKSWKIIDNS